MEERDLKDLTDWVARSRRGEAAAQEKLVRELAPGLLRLARRLGCSAEDAEELVADALYKGICKLRSLRDDDKARAWFSRILVHKWRDFLRKRRLEFQLEELSEVPTTQMGPEESAVEAELRDRVDDALETLPVGQRAVMALHLHEGLSIGEIADALRSTPERVKANLWHARRRLQERLRSFLEGGER